LRRNLLTSS